MKSIKKKIVTLHQRIKKLSAPGNDSMEEAKANPLHPEVSPINHR
ncbi:hypothetical protein QG37_08172 [Candidozyma auris]|nr:hypothetical protein QG37_08172 [[Candida] auris]